MGGGGGGYAGEALEKIQGDAFGGEEDARVAFEGGEDVAGRGAVSVAEAGEDGGAGAVGGEDEGEKGQAAGDEFGAGDEVGATKARGGGEGGGGAVAGACGFFAEAEAGEVFVAGEFHEASEVGEVEIVPGEAQEEGVEGVQCR